MKQCFVVISNLITQYCGMYELKTPFRLIVISLKAENVALKTQKSTHEYVCTTLHNHAVSELSELIQFRRGAGGGWKNGNHQNSDVS